MIKILLKHWEMTDAVNDSGLADVSQRWIVGNVNLTINKDSKELN